MANIKYAVTAEWIKPFVNVCIKFLLIFKSIPSVSSLCVREMISNFNKIYISISC